MVVRLLVCCAVQLLISRAADSFPIRVQFVRRVLQTNKLTAPSHPPLLLAAGLYISKPWLILSRLNSPQGYCS